MRANTTPRISEWLRSNVLGLVAIFIALSGTAYATHPDGANTISSGDIINGEVKNDDLAVNAVGGAKIADRSVKNADLSIGASSSNTIADGGIQAIDVKNNTLTGTQIAEETLSFDNSLTGDDIDESTLSDVPSEPSGPAGGDLTGTYPNPTIANGAVTADKIGSIPVARAFLPSDGSGGTCVVNQTIPGNGALTPMLFRFTSFDSTGTMHPADPDCNDPNRSRITAPRDGIYQVSAGVVWTGDVGGTRFLGLRRNGNNNNFVAASRVPSFADIPEQSVSTLVRLNASENEFVEAVVSQNSGSPVSLDMNFARQHLAMHWVAPGG